MHSADDLAMHIGDFNGHIGRHIDGFEGVHGGYGVCQINFTRVLPGERIVSNAWHKVEKIGKRQSDREK